MRIGCQLQLRIRRLGAAAARLGSDFREKAPSRPRHRQTTRLNDLSGQWAPSIAVVASEPICNFSCLFHAPKILYDLWGLHSSLRCATGEKERFERLRLRQGRGVKHKLIANCNSLLQLESWKPCKDCNTASCRLQGAGHHAVNARSYCTSFTVNKQLSSSRSTRRHRDYIKVTWSVVPSQDEDVENCLR